MKKLLPVLILVGLLIIVGGYFLLTRNKDKGEQVLDEEDNSAMIEVSREDAPIVYLVPRADGHWIDMKIDNIGTFDFATMEYELVYTAKTGQQGATGNNPRERIENGTLERELLLGSESSGKFRYDEDISQGTFTVSFRNDKGKLIAKFASDFHFQTNTDTLSTLDDSFSLTLEDESDHYFITMEVFGVPNSSNIQESQSTYGVFSSTDDSLTANVPSSVMSYSDMSWNTRESVDLQDTMFFVK